MRVLICGGGVIGTSIAYFLSLRQVEAVVIERTGVACAASGKSGGFLALDWCDGSALAPLARRSFELHAELAAAFPDRWGYRRLETLSVVASARRSLGGSAKPALPQWVAREARLQQRLGTDRDHGPGRSGRVHPRHDGSRARSRAPGCTAAASPASSAARTGTASPASSSTANSSRAMRW